MIGLLPLLRAADFQAAWYFSLLASAVLGITLYGAWLVVRQARPMWRNGDRALASTLLAVTAVTLLLILSMGAQVAVTLLQSALRGS